MATVNLPYTVSFIAKGRRYFYYRRAGRRVPLPNPSDPAFVAAYTAAHEAAEALQAAQPPAAPATTPGSLAALIAAYRASEDWSGLAPASRTDYNKALDPLWDRYGKLPVATMPRAFVFKLRDDYARSADGTPTPRRANRMVNVLRLLMSWAVDRGWRKDNPALRPGRLRTGPGYRAWTHDDFAAFMAADAAPEALKRAAALGYYTGQRKQDCLAMLWSARRAGAIEVVPEKTKNSTGVRLWIPEHPDLTRVLDAAPRSDATTILTRADGRPWKVDHFNHAFASAVAAAGLSGLSFHGLRKAASARMAEAGATDAEIDSILGHADPKMTRLYRNQADQKVRATAAIGKLTGVRGSM